MADQLEPQTPMPLRPRLRVWLAGNRKLAILTGSLVVLVALTAAVLSQRSGLTPSTNTTNSTSSSNSSSGQNGRTFERFQAVVNRPEPSTAVNVNRPTKEDTAKAIQELTNPKP